MGIPREHDALKLVASPGAWRLYSARKMDKRFKSFEQRVLQRDVYTCQFCGFQAKLFQEVVNLDANYTHNKFDNLVTACCFCAQCFFIESVGVGGYGGGSLIHLPEMSQASLNSLCHVLFCAITNDTGFKGNAQTLYRSFKSRSDIIEKKFGEGTSDPATLGQLLIDCNVYASPEKMAEIFKDVRLLPSRAKFRRQIEQWAASAVREMSQGAG